MSFFFGGSDSAAPVLVKHIASDFRWGWLWVVGDVMATDDDDDEEDVDSPVGEDWFSGAT